MAATGKVGQIRKWPAKARSIARFASGADFRLRHVAGAAGLARRSRNRAKSVPISIICEAGEEAASPSLNLRKLVAEGTVGAHLNTVLRLVVGGSLLLV